MSLNEVVNVKQYCPAAKVDVAMSIQGEMRGSLMDGRVVDCSFKDCMLFKSKKCWIGAKILTAADELIS